MTAFEECLCADIDALARRDGVTVTSKSFSLVDYDHLRLHVASSDKEVSEVIELRRSKVDIDYRLDRLNVLVGGLVAKSKFN